MGISLESLPKKYQEQARKKYESQRKPIENKAEEPKKNKYKNRKAKRTTKAGETIMFDSQKEARRYDELILLLLAGEITDLRLQAEFTILEGYVDAEGRRMRGIRYRADFTYQKNGCLVVEDVKSKGTKTKEYLLKKKMIKERLGINIVEV